MNVNSYIYGNSFYHRFDVRPKLALTLLFALEAIILDRGLSMAIVFTLPLVVMVLSLGIKETWRCFSRILPLIILLFLFAPLQERGGSALIVIKGHVIITKEGLSSVIRIVSRLSGISTALMLLLLTERSERIIKGLRAFHLPYGAALSLSMILRFIPFLCSLFGEIRDSMSLRLEEGKRGYPILPSITALLVASIRMIPDTAAALEERGFGREGRVSKEIMERPQGYSIQWLISAIILAGLFLVR